MVLWGCCFAIRARHCTRVPYTYWIQPAGSVVYLLAAVDRRGLGGTDFGGRQTRFATCLEYLHVCNLSPIVPTPTPLSIKQLRRVLLGGARAGVEGRARSSVCTAGRAVRVPVCIHTRGARNMHFLVPLPNEFVAAIPTISLDVLLAGSKFDSIHRGSLVRCSIGRADFDIDYDAATAEAEYGHEVFCLCNYDTG